MNQWFEMGILWPDVALPPAGLSGLRGEDTGGRQHFERIEALACPGVKMGHALCLDFLRRGVIWCNFVHR